MVVPPLPGQPIPVLGYPIDVEIVPTYFYSLLLGYNHVVTDSAFIPADWKWKTCCRFMCVRRAEGFWLSLSDKLCFPKFHKLEWLRQLWLPFFSLIKLNGLYWDIFFFLWNIPCRTLASKSGFCNFWEERQSEAVVEVAVICCTEPDVLQGKNDFQIC